MSHIFINYLEVHIKPGLEFKLRISLYYIP